MKKFLSTFLAFMLGSVISLGIVYAQNSTTTFPDVDYNAYYANALNTMVLRGVIEGYENGNFGPNDYVTRAQVVTMLQRNDVLLNDYAKLNNSRIFDDIRPLLCEGLEKDSLPTDHEIWGNVQEKYDRVCSSPWN